MRPVCIAIALSGAAISSLARAGDAASLGSQFLQGRNSVSFSILVPVTEGEKRVERVTLTCDDAKCRVQIESISYRACEGSQLNASAPAGELTQINDYGPDEKEPLFRPKVTPSGENMLAAQYVDGGQDVRLRILLRWEKSISGTMFLAAGGVVGEEEVVGSPAVRFAPIVEIVGTPIICHARFQSR